MEKRKLKYMYQRIPKERVKTIDLKREISKRAGISIKYVDIILYELSEIIEEKLLEKKTISLPNIGTIYPTIKPGKNVVNMHNSKEKKGAELMYMPDRWVCKFKIKPSIAKSLLQLVPTKEEVDNIYRD